MDEDVKVVRRPEQLTRTELERFVRAVVNYAYLDVDGDGDDVTYEPDLTVDGGDYVQSVLELIDSFGLTPAAGPVPPRPVRLMYPWDVREKGIAVGGVTEGVLYRVGDALYLIRLPGPGQSDGDVEYVGPLGR